MCRERGLYAEHVDGTSTDRRDILTRFSRGETRVLQPAYALIAHDTQAAKYCHLAGTKLLAVPKQNLRAFRSAIGKLGFVIPNGQLPS